VLVANRGLVRALRSPAHLLAATALPLALLWATDQLFGALPAHLIRFPTGDYLTYAAPGLCVLGALPGAVLCGASLAAERRSGVLDQLLAAPVARVALLGGAVLTGVILSALTTSVLVLAISLARVGIAAGVAAFPALLSLAALASVPFCVVAFVVAALVRRDSTLMILCGTLACAGLVLSNALLPATLLPDWLVAVSAANPISYALDGARAVVWSPVDWQTFREQALTLALIAICSVIGALLLFPRTVEAG
jgi:ABC-2 type transport system permease protein